MQECFNFCRLEMNLENSKEYLESFRERESTMQHLKLEVAISKVNQLIHQIIFGVHTNSKQI